VELLNEEVLMRDLIALKPDHWAGQTRLAQILCRTNRLDEASRVAAVALGLKPEHAEVQMTTGEIWMRLGKTTEAIACLTKALQIQPDHVPSSLMLGRLLLDTGQNLPGANHILNAIKALPGDASAHLSMAMALSRLGKHADALNAYKVAAKGDPPTGDVLNNYGVALDGAGRKAEAITLLRAAVLVQPDSWTAWDNLGNALLSRGNARMAESCHRHALALKPDNPATLSNLANALHRQGKMDESIHFYREAIKAAPDSSKFHTNLALTLLLVGQFEEGWKEYGWRWHGHPAYPKYLRDKPWNGERLKRGTLLIQAEQGFGDTLQFIRYIPQIKKLVKRAILICQPELVRIMKTVVGLDDVLPEGAEIPPFDAGITLLSLPGLFKAGTIPIEPPQPYISPPPGCGFDLGPKTRKLRVGLVWAGRQTHGDDWNRSMPAHLLAPLFQIPEIEYVSLQKGEVADRIGRPPTELAQDIGNRCTDFADTAAMIAQLDLVITVDTSVSHLAGAMGKPVWIMLPLIPDFRWRLQGDTTPWYSNVTLFRRKEGDGWERVVNSIAIALKQVVEALSKV
jgi:Flp pilus assembly protein TadD